MNISSPKDCLTIRRILKVNHAGELGAIRIYQAQILLARILYPDIAAKLEELLAHEKEHCRIFRQEMRPRAARPCRASFLWSLGGFILGSATALMGRSMIMVCTEAVEETVHRHLEDQLWFLEQRDPVLYTVIVAIQKQEHEHLEFAKSHIMRKGFAARSVEWIVRGSTEIVIFLSTWGDSIRMRRSIQP
ncbi:MAG: demethoxyubiquinone hydroxylase family protein [Alphaproteobacteria bacterium]|nr:demethoxyubiquinone hydroxylase family protein [Alphaproteobacteria bacterium]